MTTALITALALSIGFGLLGWVAQRQIWNGTRAPSSPVEYGRKFAGYVVIATAISGANFFIKNELGVALIKFAITFVTFPILGFAVGWLYGHIKKPTSSPIVFDSTNSELSAVDSVKVPFRLSRVQLLVVAAGVVLACVLYFLIGISADVFKSDSGKKSNWVPYSNIHVPSYLNLEVNGKFNYYDESSIEKSGAYTYGFIGSDTEQQGSDGRNFVKQKVEADCSVPKYRRIENYAYSGNLENGLGTLIVEDRNFQKTIATKMLAGAKNYVHNGGWTSREDALKDIKTYSSSPYDDASTYGHMVAYAKRDLAILNWLCN